MIVRTVMARAKSVADAVEVCRYVSHSLQLRQQPGYVGGVCSISLDDEQCVFIIEGWGTREAMERWHHSETRKQAVEDTSKWLEEEWNVRSYEAIRV